MLDSKRTVHYVRCTWTVTKTSNQARVMEDCIVWIFHFCLQKCLKCSIIFKKQYCLPLLKKSGGGNQWRITSPQTAIFHKILEDACWRRQDEWREWQNQWKNKRDAKRWRHWRSLVSYSMEVLALHVSETKRPFGDINRTLWTCDKTREWMYSLAICSLMFNETGNHSNVRMFCFPKAERGT